MIGVDLWNRTAVSLRADIRGRVSRMLPLLTLLIFNFPCLGSFIHLLTSVDWGDRHLYRHQMLLQTESIIAYLIMCFHRGDCMCML